MSYRSTILINLIIIPPLIRLIAKEMNSRIIDSRNLFFILEMLEAVGFVPAGGEDVEGDLAAYGETVLGERGRRLVELGLGGGSG